MLCFSVDLVFIHDDVFVFRHKMTLPINPILKGHSLAGALYHTKLCSL